jgi:Glycosyl hydrolases family 18
MNRIGFLIVVCALLGNTAHAQQKYVGWSAGYLPDYANFPVSSINWKCYTHVMWFSVTPNSSGVVGGLNSSTAKSFAAACHQNNTKAIICVGGAGAASSFETATANATILNTFVNSMVTLMQTNSFDGIDIDWEDDGNGITASRYMALFVALNTALTKITPKPLLTAAVADYFSNASAPVYPYCDQMNIMSYYDDVNSSAQEVSAFTNKGVPKSKLGIGYGYDVDQEVDGPNECGNGPNGNPTDINAKCLYSINNGCGGIMIWEIDRAPKVCDSVTAHYVNKIVTASIPYFADREISENMLTVRRNRCSGISEICYTVPGSSASAIDLTMYDASGALVRTLVHGLGMPGTHSYVLEQDGLNCNSGIYVFKLRTNSRTAATKAFVVR